MDKLACTSLRPHTLFSLATVTSAMCGRLPLFALPSDLEKRFGAEFVEDWESGHNLALQDDLAVMTNERTGAIE